MYKYLPLLFLFTSCALLGPSRSDLSKELSKLFKDSGYESKEFAIHNGFVKKVSWNLPEGISEVGLNCGKTSLALVKEGREHSTFFSADYYEKKSNILCDFSFIYKGESFIKKAINAKVIQYKYPARKLNVNKKHVELSPKDLKRWQGEVARLKEVYANAIKDRKLFFRPFKKPLKTKITSIYGTKRVFNDKKEAWHSGIDFRARYIPIPSANRGKVVFTGDLFFNGKTVIIDHGMGILTLYCHLSKIKVSEGDIVAQGSILGISGNTGRSTAPHLHWGVRVADSWVNGFSVIKESM